MNSSEVNLWLKNHGTEQNKKIYSRHDESINKDLIFGVSFKNLKEIRKKIKINHKLAIELFNTKFLESKILATWIIDKNKINNEVINFLLREEKSRIVIQYIFNYVIADLDNWKQYYLKYKNDTNDLLKMGAYDLLSTIVITREENEYDSNLIKDILIYIQDNINYESNWTKYSLNNLLISIGLYNESFSYKAIKIAEKIDNIEVYQGETSCKTPNAFKYIEKSLEKVNFKKRRTIKCF